MTLQFLYEQLLNIKLNYIILINFIIAMLALLMFQENKKVKIQKNFYKLIITFLILGISPLTARITLLCFIYLTIFLILYWFIDSFL